MKKIRTLLSLLSLLLLAASCIGPDFEANWEDMPESNFTEQLNVMAIISLDRANPSLVAVHKTLPLTGPESVWAGRDTVWYGEGPDDYWNDERYESLYAVHGATVIISDGINSFEFHEPSEADTTWEKLKWAEEALYVDTLGLFSPQPMTTYTLEVVAPEGHVITGEVTTPPIPAINGEGLPDTLEQRKPFTLSWTLDHDTRTAVWTQALNYWLCGADQYAIMPANTREWTSEVENCSDWYLGEGNEPDSILIEVRAMDENYYDYFVRYGSGDDFSSFALGQGSSIRSVGVEGGIGVFCAIATDRIYRIFKP